MALSSLRGSIKCVPSFALAMEGSRAPSRSWPGLAIAGTEVRHGLD